MTRVPATADVPASADKLRDSLLEQLYKAWQARPDTRDYFAAHEVWNQVRAKVTGSIDTPLAEDVFKSLIAEHKIKLRRVDRTTYVRITEAGREDFENRIQRRRPPDPWVSGSLCMAACLVLIACLGVLAGSIPPLALPLVLMAAILLVVLVGFRQLKNDERIKEKTFRNLLELLRDSLLPLFQRLQSGRPRRS